MIYNSIISSKFAVAGIFDGQPKVFQTFEHNKPVFINTDAYLLKAELFNRKEDATALADFLRTYPAMKGVFVTTVGEVADADSINGRMAHDKTANSYFFYYGKVAGVFGGMEARSVDPLFVVAINRKTNRIGIAGVKQTRGSIGKVPAREAAIDRAESDCTYQYVSNDITNGLIRESRELGTHSYTVLIPSWMRTDIENAIALYKKSAKCVLTLDISSGVVV